MRSEAEKAIRAVAVSLTMGLVAVCLTGPGSRAEQTEKTPQKGKQGTGKPAPNSTGLSAEDTVTFTKRFQAEVWPLISRKESNCLGCHAGENGSQLRLSADSAPDFKHLLTDGHLDPESPTSLLARVTSPDTVSKMPPAPLKPWNEAEIAVLRDFVNDLYGKQKKGRGVSDEMFPAMLTMPYRSRQVPMGVDNTFLTFTQLRGKIKTIFNDEWRQEERDLFAENIAQFGGADFIRSFNESSRPTAQFLSGVDKMGKDIAIRAYLAKSGPFAGRAETLPSPLNLTVPTLAYKTEINRLYRRMLYRDATPEEVRSAFIFLKSIYREQKAIAAQSYDLRFELTAQDENGLTATQTVTVPVATDSYRLGQTLVNLADSTGAGSGERVVRRRLNGPFTLKAGDTEQGVTVYNANTQGLILVHGVEIIGPLPSSEKRLIPVTDPTVQPQGAWRLTQDRGVACFEDYGQNKGASSLTFPLKVGQSGEYEVVLLWRKQTITEKPEQRRRGISGALAESVPVEVKNHSQQQILTPPATPLPPKGEARFTVDMSDDTVTFRGLKGVFRFAEGDGVEISNAGTRARVVADATRFIPVTSAGVKSVATGNASTFMVLAKDAQGQEKWKDFRKSAFSFYTPVGPRVVSDESADKGKLSLFYRPASRKNAFKPDAFYRVEIGYPGEVLNETAVPITVRASASSPILHVSSPVRGHVGAEVTLDATGSHNVQGSTLSYTWRQVGGAYMKLPDSHSPKVTFKAPEMTAQQAAWEGLCRALIKHPDFLFTRPPSLALTKEPLVRRRLQLVKITQDLLGRTPDATEQARLDRGTSLAQMIDTFLTSKEFADFYFRRIRLYLESHGSEEDDEPARLWTYIALNDSPFKEILTADYTVNTDWKQEPRPEYHGKSGLLTMKGFIKGKPGLPHYNYAAQVCEKFLGYVFEVPDSIVKIRNGLTAASTTSAGSVCYSCHKILTPLAYQRTRWTDEGVYQPRDEKGRWIDDSDNRLVPSYSFKGNGMEAFALQAQNKERFFRTIIQTHFVFYFGREMRFEQEERSLYKRLWDNLHTHNFKIKSLLRALLTSPEYLNGSTTASTTLPGKRTPAKHPRTLALR